MGLSRQEYRSVLPFPSLEDLPNPGNEPGSPALEAHALTSEPPGEQDAVKTGHGTTDWFQIGKGVHQGCIWSPCLFNFLQSTSCKMLGWMKHKMKHFKTAWRNLSNLRYSDDTNLLAESDKELKSLLMKVKVESEKVGLKLSIQKTEIMASSPITSWQIDGETMEIVRDFIFLGSKITADGNCSHEVKDMCSLEEKR